MSILRSMLVAAVAAVVIMWLLCMGEGAWAKYEAYRYTLKRKVTDEEVMEIGPHEW